MISLLQKPVLWKPSNHKGRAGELRCIMPAGPEQLTLQALSSEQRGHRVFIDRLSWATLAANRLVSTKRFHAREQQSRQGGACLTRTGMINQVCRG